MPRIRRFTLMAGDLLPVLDFLAVDGNGDALNLSGGLTAKFLMASVADNGDVENVIEDDAEIVSPATSGRVRYTWQEGDTDEPGRYLGVFEVYDGTDKLSLPNDGYIEITILPRIGEPAP